MPNTNWLGRLTAHFWTREIESRGTGIWSRRPQPRQRRGGSLCSTVPAMVEILEPRRVLSGASVTDLAFAQDSVMPGAAIAHGRITGTVTGVSIGVSESAWIEIDRVGDGTIDGTVNIGCDSFSYETDVSVGYNMFRFRVVVADGLAMTMTSGDWQDFAFDVAPPPNTLPDIDPTSIQTSQMMGSFTAGTTRGFTIAGLIVDNDGPNPNRFIGVELDVNGDGTRDTMDFTGSAFSVQSYDINGIFPTTVRIRAVECSGAMNNLVVVERAGAWHEVTLTPSNVVPVFTSTSYTIQVDPFPGAEYVLPEAHDWDLDFLQYSLSAYASFIEVVPFSRTIRVTDEVAMRQAIASGATFTLTADDGFGGTGITQITFVLAPGCTVWGQAMATANVAENVLWSNLTTSSNPSTLASTTLTLSGETLSTGGVFDPNRFILTRASSVGWVSGHPDWDVTQTTSAPANGALQPANVVITTSPDGLNQSATLTSTETVTIVDNSFFGGGAPVATMVYVVTVTISTDGTTAASRSLVSFVPMAAYNPYTVRKSTGIFTWMNGAATLAGSLTD